ncbi:MAG: hypothetical protein IJH31_01145 [Erysipelotrichaceae bacterium]|nr:hypothetical protein [Erysipelotrichaceae bacterium]
MLSFAVLLFEAAYIVESEQLIEHFEDFFIPENFDDYLIDDDAGEKDKTSIRRMFCDTGDILTRANSILKDDPFCLEANYVSYRLNEETIVDSYFKGLYLNNINYDSFTNYEKKNYLQALSMYVEFLSEIRYRTLAIKVAKKIAQLEGKYNHDLLLNLAFLYSVTENADEFYELYLNVEFEDIVPYLLLICVELKNDDEIKAKEVLSEFLNKYEYGTYIDHIWDLENDSSMEAVEFKDAVNLCFDELVSVPYFFTWCSNNKERNYQS